LNAEFVPPGALGIDISNVIAVFFRIGIDETAEGPVFRGHLRLDPPPSSPVPGDDDLAPDIDSQTVEIISRRRVLGVGYKTLNSSMRASNPQALYWARMNMAFSLP
jgi:hypothetical protein